MRKIELLDGKYTVILHDDGRQEALRYGEPWRDLTGDGLIYALATRVLEAEDEIKADWGFMLE